MGDTDSEYETKFIKLVVNSIVSVKCLFQVSSFLFTAQSSFTKHSVTF